MDETKKEEIKSKKAKKNTSVGLGKAQYYYSVWKSETKLKETELLSLTKKSKQLLLGHVQKCCTQY